MTRFVETLNTPDLCALDHSGKLVWAVEDVAGVLLGSTNQMARWVPLHWFVIRGMVSGSMGLESASSDWALGFPRTSDVLFCCCVWAPDMDPI